MDEFAKVQIKVVGGHWVWSPLDDITAKELADCLNLVLLRVMAGARDIGEVLNALPDEIKRHFVWTPTPKK